MYHFIKALRILDRPKKRAKTKSVPQNTNTNDQNQKDSNQCNGAIEGVAPGEQKLLQKHQRALIIYRLQENHLRIWALHPYA